MRRLLDDPHDAISEQLDDLEDRLDDAEAHAETALVPNHDHAELQRSVDALRADLTALQHEMTHVATLPIGALAPLEARIEALEGQVDRAVEAAEETAQEAPETATHEVESAIELPAEVVVPKRVHPMRSGSWPRIL